MSQVGLGTNRLLLHTTSLPRCVCATRLPYSALPAKHACSALSQKHTLPQFKNMQVACASLAAAALPPPLLLCPPRRSGPATASASGRCEGRLQAQLWGAQGAAAPECVCLTRCGTGPRTLQHGESVVCVGAAENTRESRKTFGRREVVRRGEATTTTRSPCRFNT